jgi:hypothetical protein
MYPSINLSVLLQYTANAKLSTVVANERYNGTDSSLVTASTCSSDVSHHLLTSDTLENDIRNENKSIRTMLLKQFYYLYLLQCRKRQSLYHR